MPYLINHVTTATSDSDLELNYCIIAQSLFAGLNFARLCGEQSLDKSNQWLGPKVGFFVIGL